VKKHSEQNLKTANRPNAPQGNRYNFFHTEKSFFVISETQTDRFHNFFTIFCYKIGYAALHMHYSKCVGAVFCRLNSLRIGFGVICPTKRSYYTLIPGQTTDAVGQTLTSHPPFQP
jgi:hypothetical protein